MEARSSVTLGNSLDLVLLADSVRSASRTLSSVDDLVSQSLLDALEVTESCLTSTLDDQVNCLVHSSQRRHVDGLTAHRAA